MIKRNLFNFGLCLIVCLACIPTVLAVDNYKGDSAVDGGTIAPNASFPFETDETVCAYYGLSPDFQLLRVYQSMSAPVAGWNAGVIMYSLEGSPASYTIPYPGYDGEYWIQGAYCGGQPKAGKYYLQSSTPPATNRTITVHTVNLANTDLENMYVEIWNSDFSYSNADFTASNGHVVFNNVTILDSNQTLTVHVMSSDIYTSYEQSFEITANTEIVAVMLSASPSGTYRNITYHVQSNIAYPLSSIWVSHIVSPDFQLGDTTDINGNVTFNNVPVVSDSAYYEANVISPNTGYQSSSGYFAFTGDMSKTITLNPSSFYPTPTPTYTGGVTPTPTPTPTPIGQYALYLTAYPDSINLGSSVSLTGSSSNPSALTYAGGLRRTSFYVNVHPSTYPFDYQMIGIFENVNATYWKFRANNSATWNTPTTASPLTLVNTPKVNGLLTYAFNAYDTNGAIATAGTDDVLVGGGAGGGALTIKLGAYDATTTGRIQNFQLNITDEGSGVVTEFGTVAYDTEITLPRGNGYVARASKTGYQTSSTIGETGTLLFIVPTSLNIQKGDFGAVFNVPLFPDGSVIAGNTSISSRVFDIETYYPISGVQVINSNAPTDIKYTGTDAESVAWVIPHNTAFTLTASKSGYCTITESKNTGTLSSMWIPLYLKYGSCTGASATPTPTPTITPTATPIGGWGNLTGGATVCGVMPDDATIIDILKNSMACNGLEDTQSQNLGMSMLIILFAAIILGRIAKGVGVLAGAIIGTVISTIAGFLPFWIIIVVIIMAGLVFAGKVFWSNSQ